MFRVLLFMFFGGSLMAQNNDDTITYAIDLDDYVITAQYEPTHYKEAIHNVSLIKKETIAKVGAVTLDQALILSPAIRISEDAILGTSIRMRGVSAVNVAVLMDGIPVIGRNDGAIDISQISLQNVERIEIVEGPLSSLYGNNAAGGVINIITKKSQTNKWRAKLSNQIESISQRNHTASLGFQQGNLNVGVHGRYFEYDQYQADSMRILDSDTLTDGSVIFNSRYPFNPKTQKSYGTYLRYNLDENNYLMAKYDFNLENVIDYGIIKRPQFNPYAIDQFYDTRREDFSLNYSGKVKEHLFINAQLAANTYDRIRDDKWYYIDSMSFDDKLQNSDSIRFEQVFGRASINYTGLSNWTIGGGYNFTNEKGEGDRILVSGAQDSLVASFTEAAVYSNIKYKGISNIDLSLTNRYIRHSTYKDAFTSSIQAKIDFNKKTSLRSSFAQGYRSPTLKELYLEFIDINHNIIGNVDLQPERSFDLQSTITYQLNKGIKVGLNGYYTHIEDRITLIQYETLKFQYDNTSKYRSYGFQPSLHFNQNGISVNSNLSIGFWSTYIKIDEAPQIGRVLDWNTTYAIPVLKTGISIFANHRYVGSQPVYQLQNENIEVGSIESYHLVDLSISKGFWKDKIKVTAGARNVFDTKSVQLSNGSKGTHSDGLRNNISIGRSMFLTLNFDFE